MTRKPDTQSLISKIQSQVEKKDNSRRFSKDLNAKRPPTKVSNSYTSAFINSQLRNKSFDHNKGDISESFMSRGSNDDRRYSKDKERGERDRDRERGEKLHESFSYLKESGEDLKSKSLYFTEFNVDDQKKQKNIKLSDYFQKCGELMGRVSVSKDDKPTPNIHYTQSILSQFQDFKIEDISSLIELIDTCVEEANCYISDLTYKMERLMEESEELKRVNRRLEEMNKTHLVVIKEKDDQLNKLSKAKPATRNQDLKNLLKVIDQLNEENNLLKREIEVVRSEQSKAVLKPISAQKKREMYNEIHRKVDILNISISREEETTPPPQSIKEVNQEGYGKDTIDMANMNTGSKKYKYIKPKSMSSM